MTREEAIKIVREKVWLPRESPMCDALEMLIPELAENEDERVRKNLNNFIKLNKNSMFSQTERNEFINYLEKQKEQKPAEQNSVSGDSEKPNDHAEWSEEDYIAMKDIDMIIRTSGRTEHNKMALLNWLKSRYSQQKHGWRRFIWAVNLRFDYDGLVRYEDNGSYEYEIVTAGNKPKRHVGGEYILLRDISQADWKPTEEQMEALMLAIEGKCPPTSYMSRRLEDLYEGLANTSGVECDAK